MGLRRDIELFGFSSKNFEQVSRPSIKNWSKSHYQFRFSLLTDILRNYTRSLQIPYQEISLIPSWLVPTTRFLSSWFPRPWKDTHRLNFRSVVWLFLCISHMNHGFSRLLLDKRVEPSFLWSFDFIEYLWFWIFIRVLANGIYDNIPAVTYRYLQRQSGKYDGLTRIPNFRLV